MKLLHQFYTFIVQQQKEYSILNLAAQLSYRILLAFIPFIMLIYNLINWLTKGLDDHILESLRMIFPDFLDDLLITATTNASGPQTSPWANIVFSFFVIYAAVCASRSVLLIMNKILLIPEKRNYFFVWGVAILYLIIFVFLIAIVFYIYFFTQKISTLFFEIIHLSKFFINFWKSFTMIYVSAIIAILVTGIYMFAPSQKLSLFQSLPGAIFVSLGWLSIVAIYELFVSVRFQTDSFFSSIEGPFELLLSISFVSF
ncbi:MAG: YhjD/YihY/BrkB family envelope integrity protein, partial [Eubacterium sp.]